MRSVPLDALVPLLRIPDVAFFSLQKDAPMRLDGTDTLVDLAPELGDFADTAAAMAALDLVITVDTAAAHLAGALGQPVWVMLGFAADRSEEHTSELQSLMRISYAVFCLKKKKQQYK